MLLKKGALRKLTPFTIGSMMCRESLKKESVIEQIVKEAEQASLPGTSEDAFFESVSVIMDYYLDLLLNSNQVDKGILCRDLQACIHLSVPQ